ncbi:MAG: hypothetical protein Fur0011_1200 [Candidatus Microgenomates bacterium]
MNKKLMVGLSVLSLIAISSTTAAAYRGDPNKQGPNYDPARHAALQETFSQGESGYSSWLKLMEGKATRLKEIIKDSKVFAEFANAQKQGQSAISAFRAKYNLGNGNGNHTGYGRNR